jgi:type I restriction enzyme S subunit
MKTNIVSDTSEHISEAAVSAGHALAPAGTTFIVVRGMILQHTFPVCLAAVPMAFNQDVKALVPKEDLEPEYLALWCRWAAPRLLRQVSETSHGTKRLEFDRIRSMPFSSATRREQVALIDEHRDLEEVVSAIDSKRAALARVQCSVLSRMGAA